MFHELPPTAGLPLQWGDFTSDRTPSLEEKLADFLQLSLGAESVFIGSSGTACLRIGLETLKQLRPERKVVVVPAFTCPLVAIAVADAGLTLRLCDLLPDSYDFDPVQLRELVDDSVLAVIPTHMGGLPADMQTALDAASLAGAFVIEDAAQALGARWHGRPVGTIGDIGMYSLTVGKGLTIFEGGVLVARDEALKTRLMSVAGGMASSSMVSEISMFLQLLAYKILYNPVGLHFAYGVPRRAFLERHDEARAVGDVFARQVAVHGVSGARKRVAASALDRLQAFLDANAAVARRRLAELNAVKGLRALAEHEATSGSWPFLSVVFDDAGSCKRALDALWKSGLGVTRLFAHALTEYEYLRDIVPSKATPQAQSFANRALTLTNSDFCSDADFRRVVEVLKQSI